MRAQPGDDNKATKRRKIFFLKKKIIIKREWGGGRIKGGGSGNSCDVMESRSGAIITRREGNIYDCMPQRGFLLSPSFPVDIKKKKKTLSLSLFRSVSSQMHTDSPIG